MCVEVRVSNRLESRHHAFIVTSSRRGKLSVVMPGNRRESADERMAPAGDHVSAVRETYRIPARVGGTVGFGFQPREPAHPGQCHGVASKHALCGVRRQSRDQPRRARLCANGPLTALLRTGCHLM
jgi:hypothetical protein